MGFLDELARTGVIVPVTAIVMGALIAILVISGYLVTALVKALRNTNLNRVKDLDSSDTQTFQELQRGFQRMEQRIEALETLLIDRSRHDSVSREL